MNKVHMIIMLHMIWTVHMIHMIYMVHTMLMVHMIPHSIHDTHIIVIPSNIYVQHLKMNLNLTSCSCVSLSLHISVRNSWIKRIHLLFLHRPRKTIKQKNHLTSDSSTWALINLCPNWCVCVCVNYLGKKSRQFRESIVSATTLTSVWGHLVS